jgi:hypothetical protein
LAGVLGAELASEESADESEASLESSLEDGSLESSPDDGSLDGGAAAAANNISSLIVHALSGTLCPTSRPPVPAK